MNSSASSYPYFRPRRLRTSESLRLMVRETDLAPHHFVYPVFVSHGKGVRLGIDSMPGINRLSIDLLLQELDEIYDLGIPSILLFGLPDKKDEYGTGAYSPDGIIQQAIAAIKKACPKLILITDVCLCEYTSTGHCGVVVDGYVDNDKTLKLLAKTALSHAEAGADIVAPSDMMDGRVAAIRAALDARKFFNIPIMSYAAKYASSFYGPFREAAECSPQFGDRRSYQMDPANAREALLEVGLDVSEGADIIMVKPALAYLDLIRRVKDSYNHPVAAFNVSGEYSMVKAAAQRGWVDEKEVTLEILTAIKRAGADIIITYHAKEAARWLS